MLVGKQSSLNLMCLARPDVRNAQFFPPQVFFIPERKYLVPFSTMEKIAQPPTGPGSVFVFDPFPLDCVAVDALGLLSDAATQSAGGGSPIPEVGIFNGRRRFLCWGAGGRGYGSRG